MKKQQNKNTNPLVRPGERVWEWAPDWRTNQRENDFESKRKKPTNKDILNEEKGGIMKNKNKEKENGKSISMCESEIKNTTTFPTAGV